MTIGFVAAWLTKVFSVFQDILRTRGNNLQAADLARHRNGQTPVLALRASVRVLG